MLVFAFVLVSVCSLTGLSLLQDMDAAKGCVQQGCIMPISKAATRWLDQCLLGAAIRAYVVRGARLSPHLVELFTNWAIGLRHMPLFNLNDLLLSRANLSIRLGSFVAILFWIRNWIKRLNSHLIHQACEIVFFQRIILFNVIINISCRWSSRSESLIEWQHLHGTVALTKAHESGVILRYFFLVSSFLLPRTAYFSCCSIEVASLSMAVRPTALIESALGKGNPTLKHFTLLIFELGMFDKLAT